MARLRSGRRTNVALLALLPAALASGAAAFAIGSGWAAWVVAAHGVVAFVLIALAPWKIEVSSVDSEDEPGVAPGHRYSSAAWSSLSW